MTDAWTAFQLKHGIISSVVMHTQRQIIAPGWPLESHIPAANSLCHTQSRWKYCDLRAAALILRISGYQ